MFFRKLRNGGEIGGHHGEQGEANCMKQVVIENPVLNSAFTEPRRHYRFTDEGITDEKVESRRISSYFVPVPQPRKRGKDKQLIFETEWTKDRIEENKFINQVRGRVALWRQGNYTGITKTTRRLLEYWTNPQRENKLFFCQIEAMETAIYITEAAGKCGDSWIENEIRQANEGTNPGVYRIAFKMATGSGKTVVMGMLIAWQALNKSANSQDGRFSDAFLIVTPGITIRDRLRVLLPNDPNNYYHQRDLLPGDLMEQLGKAKIIITNFHSFLQREKVKAGKLTKRLLAGENSETFQETPDQMVRRVCRELGNKKNIVVINDEAHHCYRHKPDADEVKLTGDDKEEVNKREKAARVWISGLEAVKAKIGIKAICDLSATPFFLRGSGYSEGTLFPWVVSDFSLIDAIECGIVKVPRVPVADDSMTGEQPTYRDIWIRIREHLPRKGRRTEAVTGEPKLPVELEGALRSLYSNYERYYRQWEDSHITGTPPVFIVVCNNTNVSKLVYDWIAGWEKELSEEKTIVVPGQLAIFSNEQNAGWTNRPNTVLIDSEQLESGEAMSAEFKKMAAREIEEFKREYRIRFPGRDPENLTDEDLLREVMNTVGKRGKLGENVKCVVSVSMLTEGWDANTVSHILGVRAFSTQLLCEQVIGRGLRRTNYVPEADGLFRPQYAEVYGVPFSFIPCAGSGGPPKPGPIPTRVHALPERIACAITFPRVCGYRYELPAEKLAANFSGDSRYILSTQDIPLKTENAPIVGETVIHTLDDLKKRREQEVAFLIAKLTLEKYFRDNEGNIKQWLFPQLLEITKRWLAECVTCKDNTFPQMLLLIEFAHNAADKIYKAIVASSEGEKRLMPILQAYNTVGSTQYVDFDTTRPVYASDARFCHVSHVVADTESWEQKMAQALEELGEEGLLISYVKNQQLGFYIPYTLAGEEHNYIPDFIARLDDGKGKEDPLNLIIEVSGERDKEKDAKVSTAKNLWVPAVNNHGGFGRWGFMEISDPWDAKNTIRAGLNSSQI
jgi:type III restriction enzyme